MKWLLSPLKKFVQLETASGMLLLAVTVLTLLWANSSTSYIYYTFLDTAVGFRIGSFEIYKSLSHWINDGLMVIFFFVVGLEIKKEFIMGELADRKRAALPIVAALGGMVVPALIYALFNIGKPTASGWGIPMATDIAFAVGVLTLLGKRVPFALTIFLLALAIVDDLGAIIVIAFFYTEKLYWLGLAYAAAGIGTIIFLNYLGVRSRFIYIILGVVVWYAVLKSGVHATIAGVILGLITPIKPLVDKEKFRTEGFDLLKQGEEEHIVEFQSVAEEALSPADFWIRILHPWVSFLIMPLFAFANAGVRFNDFQFLKFISAPVSLGVFFGLLVGKPLGIYLFSWLSVRQGWAELPSGVNWRQIIGVAALAGIGFTMALFIGNLSIGDHSATDFAKLAILLGSLASAIAGTVILVAKP